MFRIFDVSDDWRSDIWHFGYLTFRMITVRIIDTFCCINNGVCESARSEIEWPSVLCLTWLPLIRQALLRAVISATVLRPKYLANVDTSPPRTSVNRDGRSEMQFFAKLLSTENWASILCSRRSGPSIWQSNGWRRLRQKTPVQSEAGDWWRQRNYSWEWCVPHGPGNNGGSGISNIRRRRGIHLILVLYEADVHLPAWFPTNEMHPTGRALGTGAAQSTATHNLAWFLLPL